MAAGTPPFSDPPLVPGAPLIPIDPYGNAYLGEQANSKVAKMYLARR